MDFEFSKAGVVDSLNVVPEPFRPFYEPHPEDTSKFSLVGALASSAAAIDGINKALRNARKDAKNVPDISPWLGLAGKFDGLDGDVTPDVIGQAIDRLKETATRDKAGATNWDKIRSDLEKAHATALANKDNELTGMQKSLNRFLIGRQAAETVAAAKGVPALLMPHIEARAKVVREADGDFQVRIIDDAGDPRGNSSGGFMTMADLVAELKADPVFGRAFESDNTGSAGGAPRPGGTTRSANPAQRPGVGTPLTANERIARGFADRAKKGIR